MFAVGDGTVLSSVERYDAEVDSWSPVTTMITSRTSASVAVIGEVIGGGDVGMFESLISKAIHMCAIAEGFGGCTARVVCGLRNQPPFKNNVAELAS